MPPKNPLPGRARLVVALLVATAGAWPTLAAAQDLPLQRDYPGSGPFRCPSFPVPVDPEPEAVTQAGRLASQALQAQILGDAEQAQALFEQAASTDPLSADLAYQNARVMQQLEMTDEAMEEFCRAISLESDGPDADDARVRLDQLYEAVRERVSDEARDAFISGLVQADSAFYAGAVSAFTVAIDAAPDWGAPVYNRAVMYEFMGMIPESLADYRRYLEVAPFAVDPIVVMVSERIGLLEGAVRGTPSPGGAFALGLLPGMGHYYSRRPVSGTIVLLTAAGTVAAGFLVKEVTVECLNPVPAGGACPSDEIVAESTERPYLLPALGVAAATTVISAVEALVHARRRRGEAEQIGLTEVSTGVRLLPPSVAARGANVDLNLIRLSFR